MKITKHFDCYAHYLHFLHTYIMEVCKIDCLSKLWSDFLKDSKIGWGQSKTCLQNSFLSSKGACANFGESHTRTNARVRVRVRLEFWQNAHVRAMCVRPKIECANVRACEAKNRRNSQLCKPQFSMTKDVRYKQGRVQIIHVILFSFVTKIAANYNVTSNMRQ